jgi:acyl-CoA thioesterase-1
MATFQIMSTRKVYLFASVLMLLMIFVLTEGMAQASQEDYLQAVKTELKKKWPANRTVNLVFHGHSVPSGYFRTPDVRTLEAYPHQVLQQVKSLYPTAVVNVIVTAIGGENSEQGLKRFNKEVLVHRPDVLFIDYALNDRRLGLLKSKTATEKMIRKAKKRNIRIILLTPSPDMQVDIKSVNNELEQFSKQIRELAKQYEIGLADTFDRFKTLAEEGEELSKYMSQSNHPNAQGHLLIAAEVMKYFK